MKNGFTIIEIIVALFVLTAGVVGVFSAFYVIVFLSQDSVDRFSATYLSQEGLEIIRNIRDTNWLKAGVDPEVASWDEFIVSDTQKEGGPSDVWQADCYTVPTEGRPLEQWPGEGNYLYLHSNGLYDYSSGGSISKFKRKIITTIIDDHSIKVSSQVSWDKKANFIENQSYANDCNPKNCIITEEILYNWY